MYSIGWIAILFLNLDSCSSFSLYSPVARLRTSLLRASDEDIPSITGGLSQKQDNINESKGSKQKKKFVCVGGGWAGWGAAKTLCQSNVDCDVILIDALPDPTGKTPYLSDTGKPVEAGTRGFWKDYPLWRTWFIGT
jgi:hypothetical protein